MKRCEVSDWTEADFWVPGEIEVYFTRAARPGPGGATFTWASMQEIW